MEAFKIKLHTVIVLVGPSGCGKSYLSKNHLIPQLQEQLKPHMPSWRKHPNIQYISSDALRLEVLGSDAYTYQNDSDIMMAASEQAFALLQRKLELVTSYSVNAEVVIVDTTGLTRTFRQSIVKTAQEACYNTLCIAFKYKDREDYYQYISETHDLSLVSNHIKRFNREVLAELKSDGFDDYLFIKKKDFSDIVFDIESNAKTYATHYLPFGYEYSIIGDIHGCFEEMLELLAQLRFVVKDDLIVEHPEYKVPVVVGDFIDGADTEGIIKVIKFLYLNRDKFKFVLGNHENFVYKYLNKQLDKGSVPPVEFIEKHFPTVYILEKDPQLAEMFFTLREMSKDFYMGKTFIVTHAPCAERYLGKLNREAVRAQRNFRYPHREAEESLVTFSMRFENSLSFLKKAAANNKPHHIFGHCRVKNVARVKNKIGIDTAANHGNRLTAATVVGNRIFYVSIPSKHPVDEELPEVFTHKDASVEVLPEIDLSTLDPDDFRRIKRAAKNKINYVSGTMSPSDKDEQNGTLESISKAFAYYKSKDVDKVCLQPKYMGSRTEVWVNFNDITQTYTSTRRGFLINQLDLTEAYKLLHNKLSDYAANKNLEWLLLDAELMPWYALGKGLIGQQYDPVRVGIETELKLLKETGFEEKLEALKQEYAESEYSKIFGNTPKKQLMDMFPQPKFSNYETIRHFKWISLSEQQAFFSVYRRQLEVFAQEGPIHFKPFSLLKGITKEGEEVFFNDMLNSEHFSIVSEDKCCVVDTKTGLEEAEAFFKDIISRELEGVVVKPEQVYIKGVAPYLKVRNPKYLTIIYGYDYSHPLKYQKLISQKRISRKLQTSIDEAEYGRRLLEIPRSAISMDNKEYVSLFAKLILEEKKEERFDPRL